ncbi:MAG: hypothetical protein V7746_04470 [Halioglobus sp.]
MKKVISKAEIRAHLEQEISKFEQGGGSVTKIPRGLSGHDALDNSIPATRRLFLEPTEKRTLVPEVVAAIELRRKEKLSHKPPPKPRSPLKRRRKTIYDDFGEPLRTVWVEE